MSLKIIKNSVLVVTVIAACTHEPSGPQWNNPVDPQGSSYSPPEIATIRDTSVCINDTLTLEIVSTDSPAVTEKYLWSSDGTKFDTVTTATRSFVWHSDTTIKKSLWYKVVDADGLTSSVNKVVIQVLAFAPRLQAFSDTSITVNDTLTLTISATDSLGTVKKYLWSNDGKLYDTVMTAVRSFVWFSDTTVRKTLWYKVVDDDGLVSPSKLVRVLVVALAPKTGVIRDTAITINDTLTLTLPATDSLGTIGTFLWSFDGKKYDTSIVASRSFVWFSESTTVKKVWYKVIDDDGLPSEPRTFSVRVLAYRPQTGQIQAAMVNLHDTLRLTISATDSFGTVQRYLWSEDGFRWDTTTASSKSFVWNSVNDRQKKIWYKVMDDDGLLSDVRAVDVSVLSFAPKTITIPDTFVTIRDTLVLAISATDSLGSVRRYLWSEDNNRWDSATSNTRSFIWYSSVNIDKRIWYKVIDNDGVVSEVKSVIVHLRTLPPIIETPPRTIVRWDQEATIRIGAADPNGTVVKYLWKLSTAAKWDTTDIPVWKVRHPEGGKVVVNVGAMDDDGIIGYAEASVLFNRRPDQITLDYPYDGRQHIFDEINFADTIGTIIAFGLKAADPDGVEDSLRYAVEVIDSLTKITRRIDNVADSVWVDSLLPGRWYRILYKAYDRYGDSASSYVKIFTQNYFPKGMVYFPRDPQHGVHHPFWIDTTEVTVQEFSTVLGIPFDTAMARMPAYNDGTEAYFQRLNGGIINRDVGYRYPFYSEWVRAYKNPDSMTTYYWGNANHQDVVKQYAWYDRNARSQTWTLPHADREGVQNVAQLLPNEYNLYDMSGNRSEYYITIKKGLFFEYTGRGYLGGDASNSFEKLLPSTQVGNVTHPGFRKVYSQIYQ